MDSYNKYELLIMFTAKFLHDFRADFGMTSENVSYFNYFNYCVKKNNL